MTHTSQITLLLTVLCASTALCGCTEQEREAAKKAGFENRFAYFFTPETTAAIPASRTITTTAATEKKPAITTAAAKTTKPAVQTTPVPAVTLPAVKPAETTVPAVTTTVTTTSATETTLPEPVTEQQKTTTETTQIVTQPPETEPAPEPESEIIEAADEENAAADAAAEPEPETEPEIRTFEYDDNFYYFPPTEIYPDGFQLSVQDYVLLCNCGAHEAGNLSVYEIGLVIETIMNRVYSSAFPDNIYDVITQRNQFTGSCEYANLTGFSHEVTSNCCAAVENYFCFPENYQHGYLFFYGDNYANYFS